METVTSGQGPYPAGENNYSGGVSGWEITNGTSTLTFASIDVLAYSNINLNFKLASFAGHFW